MPPTVCFIRHAQALHNVDSPRWHHLADPRLSKDGVQQCEDLKVHLKQNLPWVDKAQLIVTSPMRRTMETTMISLDWLIKKGVPVLPQAIWQENSNLPCDTGTDLAKVSKEYPAIDFATVDPLYPEKSGRYAYSEETIMQRGQDVLAWLKARPESYIIVVTHSAFLRTAVVHRRFANADYRVFRFAGQGEKGEPNSGLMELDVSSPSGGMGRSPRGWKGVEVGDFDVRL